MLENILIFLLVVLIVAFLIAISFMWSVITDYRDKTEELEKEKHWAALKKEEIERHIRDYDKMYAELSGKNAAYQNCLNNLDGMINKHSKKSK